MKTDDFVDFLATGAGPAPVFNISLRLGVAVLVGLAASLGIGMVLNGLPLPSLSTSGRWFTASYAVAMLASTWALLRRLARPVSRVGGPLWAVVLTVLVMGGVGINAAVSEPEMSFAEMWDDPSWMVCSWLILLYSLPALAAALWALRELAPTRLRLTGFAAGMFAGAQGVLGYALTSPDDSLLFVAIWYTLGMLLTGVLGALLGPKALRW